MAVDAKLQILPIITETLASGVAGASDKVIKHDLFKLDTIIKAGSTVPATTVAVFQQALSSGTATIDLTNLTGTNGASVDFTGLKLQYMQVTNTAGNGTLEIDVGATNGYNLGNNAGWNAWVPAETNNAGIIACFFAEQCPDVSASAKDIDLVGTGSESSDWILVAG